jgi:2-amino-4-hydroxy-6-hydroxymethyldihydropteridine diphosphokinase
VIASPALIRTAVGLGSNLGDRRAHLRAAVGALDRLGEIDTVSSVYETAPVGGPPQGSYLNAVVVLRTRLAPAELLDAFLEIEQSRGRQRRERWGPRSLDLDLLLYDDRVIDEPGLEVPHPEITRRRFVLEPLLEVWPEAALPDGTPLASLLPAVADQEVRRLGRLTPARVGRAATWVTAAIAVAVVLKQIARRRP